MKRYLAGLALGIAVAGTAVVAVAADAPANKPAPGMQRGMMGDGSGSMMGNMDMKGMMDMMSACQGMMGQGGMHGPASLRLPAGNEKLELQMHAEMMQKMGEIAAKYADRIRDSR